MVTIKDYQGRIGDYQAMLLWVGSGRSARARTIQHRPGLQQHALHFLLLTSRGVSNHPILEVLGSEAIPLMGLRDQKPQILGTWTLWVLLGLRTPRVPAT